MRASQMLIHSYVVRCLALAVLRQHVAVALALTLVALLTSLIRYDTRCYFNVRSKADISQLNLPHGTDN